MYTAASRVLFNASSFAHQLKTYEGLWHVQRTGLVRHVFRLLEAALKANRGIPWVLLENVCVLPSSCCSSTSKLHATVAHALQGHIQATMHEQGEGL